MITVSDCISHFCSSDLPSRFWRVLARVPQPGPARAKTWTGVLATAGGLLFYGQPNGGFTAADQRTGKSMWRKSEERSVGNRRTYGGYDEQGRHLRQKLV